MDSKCFTIFLLSSISQGLTSGSFSFTYSLYICVYFLSVGASVFAYKKYAEIPKQRPQAKTVFLVARDFSAKTLTSINKN